MDRKAYLKQKNSERKKTHTRFELSMPNSKAKRFRKLAKKEEISPNQLIQKLATSYLDECYFVSKPLKKRLDRHNFLIRNIANNINQIAHSSNVFHSAEKQNILKNLDDLNQAVQTLVAEFNTP